MIEEYPERPKGSGWEANVSMIQSNVVLESLQPIANSRPMVSDIHEKGVRYTLDSASG